MMLVKYNNLSMFILGFVSGFLANKIARNSLYPFVTIKHHYFNSKYKINKFISNLLLKMMYKQNKM